MFKHRLRKLKWGFVHLKSQLLRNRVPPHKGLQRHGLQGYQVYPKGGNLSADFFTQPVEQYRKIIDRTTPIASVGSCFAVEIRATFETPNLTSSAPGNLQPAPLSGAGWTPRRTCFRFSNTVLRSFYRRSVSATPPMGGLTHSVKGHSIPRRKR